MNGYCPNFGSYHERPFCPPARTVTTHGLAGTPLQEPSTEERIAALEGEVAELRRTLRGGETSCIGPAADERVRQAKLRGRR